MNSTEIEGLIKEALNKYEDSLNLEEVGTVFSVKDGLIRIYGLGSVFLGEVIQSKDIFALVISIEPDHIIGLVLENFSKITVGMEFVGTNQSLNIKVSDAFLGRVLDGFGKPIDGKIGIEGGTQMPIFNKAPKIMERKEISEQLITGVKAVDWMTPIGKGQRQLILGSRGSGKSVLALTTMLNIANKPDHISIYVAIGQKSSSNIAIYESLLKNNVENFIILVANASDSVAMNYLAPYFGCAIGEYFRDLGKHVVIFYDDLIEQIIAYRQISLSLGSPPGREAYSGDVFFKHASLLERAACLNEEKGGGTLTAFPIAKTTGDISGYIPTNLISITDGQIILNDKQKVDAGVSVSRTGTKTKGLKALSASLRLDYSKYFQYKELLKFSSETSKDLKKIIEKGRLLEQVLEQDLAPITEEEQILVLYAYQNSIFDSIEEFQLLSKLMDAFWDFKKEILSLNSSVIENILEKVKKHGKLSKDT